MTLYLIDISGYQPGIDLAGWHAVMAKITEGVGYTNLEFAAQRAEAAHHGAHLCAYHFLHQGNPAGQARYAYDTLRAVDGDGKTPMVIDVELTTAAAYKTAAAQDPELTEHVRRIRRVSAERTVGSLPQMSDIVGFADVYRGLGGVCHAAYLPQWYWQGYLGSCSLKPLADRRILLWSSAYTGYTDADTGTGWQGYGGLMPTWWQYTSTLTTGGCANVDCSAMRGTHPGDQTTTGIAAALAEHVSLLTTGGLPVSTSGPEHWDDPDWAAVSYFLSRLMWNKQDWGGVATRQNIASAYGGMTQVPLGAQPRNQIRDDIAAAVPAAAAAAAEAVAALFTDQWAGRIGAAAASAFGTTSPDLTVIKAAAEAAVREVLGGLDTPPTPQ